MILIGLYSPNPQSGKSTLTKILAKYTDLEIYKVSGLMKTMTAAVLNGLVDPVDDYVDGKEKDSPIPALTRHHVALRIDGMLNAFHLSIGSDTVETANGPKTREDLKTDLHHTFLNALQSILDTRPLTSRDIQKVLGLEWGRKLYGDDFWLNMLENELSSAKAPVCVIDDVRFPDDANFTKNHNGITVRIFKPDATKPDAHASEGLLENYAFDLYLDNTGTLADLEAWVVKNILPKL